MPEISEDRQAFYWKCGVIKLETVQRCRICLSEVGRCERCGAEGGVFTNGFRNLMLNLLSHFHCDFKKFRLYFLEPCDLYIELSILCESGMI